MQYATVKYEKFVADFRKKLDNGESIEEEQVDEWVQDQDWSESVKWAEKELGRKITNEEKEELKNKYKLLLLSNTNDLHIQQVIKNMGHARYIRFKNCFDKFYLSQQIHLTKPANSIYDFVLNSNNLQADECLFVDDLKLNTEAALNTGMHVWNLIPTSQDVTQLFNLKKDIF